MINMKWMDQVLGVIQVQKVYNWCSYRNFYGKFRPMTLAGLKRNKIDINTYI